MKGVKCGWGGGGVMGGEVCGMGAQPRWSGGGVTRGAAAARDCEGGEYPWGS